MAEKKTVILDDNNTTELEVPHDRNSTFELLIRAEGLIPRRLRRNEGY